MEQRSSSLEDIFVRRVMTESYLHYAAGQNPNQDDDPLAYLALDPDEEAKEKAIENDAAKLRGEAEIMERILRFAADGMNIETFGASWRRIQKRIKPGTEIVYHPENGNDDIPWPYVILVEKGTGKVIERWEPARLKFVRKARENTQEKNPAAVISYIEVTHSCAARRVGNRIISMAALAGIGGLRELSGQGVAQKLGVTRQAVSLTNRAMDSRIREATGGKTGSRNLRHKEDPRKGLTRQQIQGGIDPA